MNERLWVSVGGDGNPVPAGVMHARFGRGSMTT